MSNLKNKYILKDIKIEITYRCALACIHCSSDATPNNRLEASSDKVLQILEQARDMGIREVSFSGGEPLLHENIQDFVKYAAKYKMEVVVYTCGNDDIFEEKIKLLKKGGLSKLIFSLFSASDAGHEAVTRIKGSFNKTINAIKMSIKNNIESEIHFVALKRNYQELSDLVKLASRLGITRTSVLRFVPQGRGFLIKNDTLSQYQYYELKKNIELLRSAGYNIRTGSPFNFLLLSDHPSCLSANDRLIIAPDMRIYPCDAFKQIKAEELVLTKSFSVIDGATLQQCWEKSLFLNAVRDYLSSPFEKPCNGCDYLKGCLSGCLAQKVLVNGSFKKSSDPDCMKNIYQRN